MPVNASNSSWTPERRNALVSLWGEGFSASKIAEKMGGLTRNAVLGAAYRMNLPKRKTISSVERKKPRREKRAAVIRWRSVVEIIPEATLPPPDFIGIPLLETTRFSCMYPEGEGASIMFCGQPRKEGSSFCAGHHRICYHKAEPSKRKPFVIAA